MIRSATQADAIEIVAMALRFNSCLKVPLPLDQAYVHGMAKALIVDDDGYAAVLELNGVVRGVLLSIVQYADFAPILVAMEKLFWIEPIARGKWMRRFIDNYQSWAKTKGCLFAGMVTLADHPKAQKPFQRCGFEPVETVMMKRL